MKKLIPLILIILMAFVSGCIFDNDDDEKEADNGENGNGIVLSAENYLPLKVGATWTYTSAGIEGGEEYTREYTSTIAGTTIKDNKTYFIMFDDDSQDSSYMRIEDNVLYNILPFEENEAKAVVKRAGILSAAKRAFTEQFPSGEVPFFNFNKEAGQTWEIFSYSDSGEGYSSTFDMTGKFIGTETVTVPAGTFTNCVKYEINMGNMYSSTGEGFSESHEWRNIMTFWLAPGVGPVKIIEELSEDNEEMDSSTDKLISYSIPE